MNLSRRRTDDITGRIFRRRRRDPFQAAQDGRHRPRGLRRGTNDLPHLYYGQSHSHLDHLPQYRNRQCHMHCGMGSHRTGNLLALRLA